MIHHEIPEKEKETHIESPDCNCEPKVIKGVDNTIIKHRSLELREGVMWANGEINKVLNIK